MTQQFNPVGWFEIPVTDLPRAKNFYENMLDLELEEHRMGHLDMAWFPWEDDETGATGSLVKGEEYAPTTKGTLVYFTAPDLDATIKRAQTNGGTVLQERMSIGEYGFIAIIQDTEGNRIGLHSMD